MFAITFVKENNMVRYVKTLDELVDLIDREFSGINAVCPICKKKIGTVGIPNIELGLSELNFTQFKYPGVYCTEGHCVISMEDEKNEKHEKNDGLITQGSLSVYIEDLGIKVYEVMKLIKPYLGIDESVPNAQIYWMLMDRSKPSNINGLSREDAINLLDKLQRLGARARLA